MCEYNNAGKASIYAACVCQAVKVAQDCMCNVDGENEGCSLVHQTLCLLKENVYHKSKGSLQVL